MVRIDTQSVVVLGFALMASFGTALTIRHLEGDGMAQAATPVVEAAVGDRVLWGVGVHGSIVKASLTAILSAVNRAERDTVAD